MTNWEKHQDWAKPEYRHDKPIEQKPRPGMHVCHKCGAKFLMPKLKWKNGGGNVWVCPNCESIDWD